MWEALINLLGIYHEIVQTKIVILPIAAIDAHLVAFISFAMEEISLS